MSLMRVDVAGGAGSGFLNGMSERVSNPRVSKRKSTLCGRRSAPAQYEQTIKKGVLGASSTVVPMVVVVKECLVLISATFSFHPL